MAFQRAYVKCKECYEQRKEDTKLLESNREAYFTNILIEEKVAIIRNKADNARNEAMRALGEQETLTARLLREIDASAVKALDVCAKCDFSKPKIAELYENVIVI